MEIEQPQPQPPEKAAKKKAASKKKAYKTYPTELRKHAWALMDSGYTIPQVNIATRIPIEVLKRWQTKADYAYRKEYKELHGQPPPPGFNTRPKVPAASALLPEPFVSVLPTNYVPEAPKPGEAPPVIPPPPRVAGMSKSVFDVLDAVQAKLEASLADITDISNHVPTVMEIHLITKLRQFFLSDPPIERIGDALRVMEVLRNFGKEANGKKSSGIDAGILRMRHPDNLPPLSPSNEGQTQQSYEDIPAGDEGDDDI